MDLTVLSSYIHDSVLWPHAGKRKLTKTIISDLTETWLHMVADHYIRSHYMQNDVQFEIQFQQQIQFLASRCLDIRKEIRSYVVPIFLRYADMTQTASIPYFNEVEKDSDPMIAYLLTMLSQLDILHKKTLGQLDHFASTHVTLEQFKGKRIESVIVLK